MFYDGFRDSHKIPGVWNGLSPENWGKENEKQWADLLAGKTTLSLPDRFYSIKTDFGQFIQIQMNAMLSEPPGVFVRTCHYGPAMKVLLPTTAKAGDVFRIVRRSASGKSLIAEIVEH